MVRVSVLNDGLKTMYNAEKRGKRQVLLRPSSKVVIKFLQVMQRHGESQSALPNNYCLVARCSEPPSPAHSPTGGGLHREREALQQTCARCATFSTFCSPVNAGYIGEFEFVDDHRGGKIVVELNGRYGVAS